MAETPKALDIRLPEVEKNKLGMWLFLGGEIILFSVLILTIALARLHYSDSYGRFKDLLNIPLVGLNTFILIVSSFLVVRALEAIQHGSQRGLRLNLLGVLILGALFLGGQAYEWSELFKDDVGVKNAFGTPFFTVTGIHGTHVFIGLLWGALTLIFALRGRFSREHHQGVEIFGLYWHFVDIVWIILFTLIYLY